MAYNRRNILLRIIDVQETYKKHSKNHNGGCTARWIHREVIFPRYKISERTFYDYLAEPSPRQQLARIEQAKKEQLKLF